VGLFYCAPSGVLWFVGDDESSGTGGDLISHWPAQDGEMMEGRWYWDKEKYNAQKMNQRAGWSEG
jgi:hypothetical protein